VTNMGARLLSVAAGAVGLVLLTAGMGMRFHIENTVEAVAEETRGGRWLLLAAALFAAAAGAAAGSRAPRWAVVLVALPVVAGIAPALLLPGNIIPFGTALLSGIAAVVGLVAVLLVRR
jgi:hypothetical protein